jgi:hypothetical protein
VIIDRLEFYRFDKGEVAIPAGTPLGLLGWVVLTGAL